MTRPRLAFSIVVLVLLAALGGFLLGRLLAPSHAAPGALADAPTAASTVYTCSMHPQVRLDGPGDCPICEMPLIPAASASASDSAAPELQLSEHALAMASVETVAIEERPLVRELRAIGRIEYNESSLATITARVAGYAERLFVDFTGVEIRAGDHLAEVYSPELLVAEQELLIALQGGTAGALVDVARTKLRLLGLTEEQITALVERRETTDRVTLFSPISGTVIEKSIVEKAAFEAGDALYRIANLDSVWVYLEIYEYDLPWVRYGQRVRLTAQAVPGRTFEGLVTFVQPLVDDRSRTIRVPVHIENRDHVLKPGMFVTAGIAAALGPDGQAAPTGVEGKFTCPMHPQVLVPEKGACPICEMPLEEIPGPRVEVAPAETLAPRYHCTMQCEGSRDYPEPGRCPVCNMRLEERAPAAPHGAGVLAVPASAVLDSGTRQLVYVEHSRGLFSPRELVLGPRAGAYYPVLAGLEAGERVVTRGNFLIDSQFQITGHPSLFYPGGLHAAPTHAHGSEDVSPPPTEHPH
ncbi:MAG TPA: efflux RND transporter periplasmic adaptor subunit [Planctomycetota bacterium]